MPPSPTMPMCLCLLCPRCPCCPSSLPLLFSLPSLVCHTLLQIPFTHTFCALLVIHGTCLLVCLCPCGHTTAFFPHLPLPPPVMGCWRDLLPCPHICFFLPLPWFLPLPTLPSPPPHATYCGSALCPSHLHSHLGSVPQEDGGLPSRRGPPSPPRPLACPLPPAPWILPLPSHTLPIFCGRPLPVPTLPILCGIFPCLPLIPAFPLIGGVDLLLSTQGPRYYLWMHLPPACIPVYHRYSFSWPLCVFLLPVGGGEGPGGWCLTLFPIIPHMPVCSYYLTHTYYACPTLPFYLGGGGRERLFPSLPYQPCLPGRGEHTVGYSLPLPVPLPLGLEQCVPGCLQARTCPALPCPTPVLPPHCYNSHPTPTT